MADLPLLPSLLVLQITGKLQLPPDVAHATKRTVVFQRCPPELSTYIDVQGTPMQIRAWINTPPTGSSRQTSRRGLMRDAVAAWHNASDIDRETARSYATRRSLSLYNAWIALYLKSHTIDIYTTWDNGTTLWDSAKTLWEKLTHGFWDAGATIWDNGSTIWDSYTQVPWDAGATIWDNGSTIWQ